MKRIIVFIAVLYFSFNALAQFQGSDNRNYPLPGYGNLSGGLGMNWIDGKLFYSLHINPEISFNNFGVGLDLHFDIDQQGNLRKENYNEFSDYLSIIRYLRYGLKNDPVYLKAGALDYYTLGHGTIVEYYNNSPSYDSRKIGAVADIDFGKFGFESMYSNLFQKGIIGIRGYLRPFQFTPQAEIPIIGGMEVGASYVNDFNDKAGIINATYSHPDKKYIPVVNNGSLSAFGVDIVFPLVNTQMLGVKLYADYNKFINFGSGIATGLLFDINALGTVRGFTKLERRFNNDHYIPSYFNNLYEIERFRADTAKGTFSSKISLLENAVNQSDGYFGQLGLSIVNIFYIIGSYERLDTKPKSGVLHLQTEVNPEGAPFLLRAGFDKINIGSESAIFKLDDNSYLFTEIGYKPTSYLVISIVYNWTFLPVRDADENIIDYSAQKRVEPRISLIYPIQF